MSVSDDLTCSFTILPVRKKMEISVFFGAETVVYFCTAGHKAIVLPSCTVVLCVD